MKHSPCYQLALKHSKRLLRAICIEQSPPAMTSQQFLACLQAGKLTTKNSCARNLFRLLSGVSFISMLLQNLASDRNKPLRQAAGEAYDATLASAHGFMVRTAVKGSMYMLPTRETFLASIHETGTSSLDLSQLCTMMTSIEICRNISQWKFSSEWQCTLILDKLLPDNYFKGAWMSQMDWSEQIILCYFELVWAECDDHVSGLKICRDLAQLHCILQLLYWLVWTIFRSM